MSKHVMKYFIPLNITEKKAEREAKWNVEHKALTEAERRRRAETEYCKNLSIEYLETHSGGY